MNQKQRRERELRFLAVPVINDLLVLPFKEAMAAVDQARAMVDCTIDRRPMAEAAHLYSRLPQDNEDAFYVLDCLTLWLPFLWTGHTDMALGRALGTVFLEKQDINKIDAEVANEGSGGPALRLVHQASLFLASVPILDYLC